MSPSSISCVLVTGANKGIGFEAVRQLSARLPIAAAILLGTRSLANGRAAVDAVRAHAPNQFANVEMIQLDVTSQESIDRASALVKDKFGSLDVLVNNAGIRCATDPAGVFDVNLFGVKRMLDAFRPLMAANAIVVNVSSEAGAWTHHAMARALKDVVDDDSSLTWDMIAALSEDSKEPSQYTWPDSKQTFGPYGISKALLSAYTRLWARQHAEMRVAAVCPGYCATDMTHHLGHRSAAVGGASVIWPIFNSFVSGQFYQDGIKHAFSTPMRDILSAQ